MVKISQMNHFLTFDDEVGITGVRGHGGERGVVHVKQHVHRMGGNNEVNENIAEIENVFDGMHGETRPRSNVDVSMMRRVPAV